MRYIWLSFIMVLALASAPLAGAEPGILAAPEAHAQINDGTLTLIDVRRPSEWAATGMPEGAVGVTLQDRDFVAQVLAALDGDRHAPVALICRTGRRSQNAARQLEAAGFTAVYNVREGVAGRRGAGPGWLARSLPVEDAE